MAKELKFGLTAYDPNPLDVILKMTKDKCDVTNSGGAVVSVEDYRTDGEGNPEYVQLKVSPEAIAFMMSFKDGSMQIEFKGNWAEFKASTEANVAPEPIAEPKPEPRKPAPGDLAAETTLCMKVHCKEDDVDPIDVQLKAKDGVIEAVGGAGVYKVVHQKPGDAGGTEFVVELNHPSGEKFVVRALLKGDKISFFNTDLWDENNLEQYFGFYIKDTKRSADIMKEIEADPENKIGILYKHGCYSEGMDFGSIISYVQHRDEDGNIIPKSSTDTDTASRANASRGKAEKSGKKGCGPPNDNDKEWSCGRVKWELPVESRTYRDAGKLKIPDFTIAEKPKEQKKVGKLNWGGFDQQEPSDKQLQSRRKSSVSDVPKVGKLNTGMFGGETNKKSWRKT